MWTTRQASEADRSFLVTAIVVFACTYASTTLAGNPDRVVNESGTGGCTVTVQIGPVPGFPEVCEYDLQSSTELDTTTELRMLLALPAGASIVTCETSPATGWTCIGIGDNELLASTTTNPIPPGEKLPEIVFFIRFDQAFDAFGFSAAFGFEGVEFCEVTDLTFEPCEPFVSVDASSWGRVKAVYR